MTLILTQPGGRKGKRPISKPRRALACSHSNPAPVLPAGPPISRDVLDYYASTQAISDTLAEAVDLLSGRLPGMCAGAILDFMRLLEIELGPDRAAVMLSLVESALQSRLLRDEW